MDRMGRFAAAALALLASLASCATEEPKLEPMTAEDQRNLSALEHYDPKLARIEDPGTLFMSLDQNLRKWREFSARTEMSDVQQRVTLEEVLTRQVYYNFDTILAQLQHGTDPEHVIIAAAALGFSRIPAPDEPGGNPAYPAVHPRAVQPLMDTLDSGNDELIVNALLSLGRIAAPETSRQALMELMVKHHNAAVRANAALALSQIIDENDRPLVLGPIFSALSDSDATVRLHAVKALGKLNEKSAVGPLVDRLRRDDTPLVRACAAMELGKLGDPSAITYLIDGLQSDAAIVAFQCHRSLVHLTGRNDIKGYKAWHDWWQESDSNPDRLKRT
jgi:hypothetical protein